MAGHKGLLARVSARLVEEKAGAGTGRGTPSSSKEVQQTTVAFVLHCADLCCPLLPPSLSRVVSEDLSREFAAQAVRERAAALPVTVMEADTDAAKAKMETGFLGAWRPCKFHSAASERACCFRLCRFVELTLTPLRARRLCRAPHVRRPGGAGADAGELPRARGR